MSDTINSPGNTLQPYQAEEMPNPPLNFDDHIAFRFRMITNLISRVTCDVSVRQSGLTEREWRVLGMLGTRGAMMPAQLATSAGMDRATITRAISQLEDMNYLSIRVDQTDKRRKLLYLTPKGVAICEKMGPELISRGGELQAVLTKTELKYFQKIMEKLEKKALSMIEGL